MPPATPLYCIFLGPPGSGKGTQAKQIIENYHVFHLSTGDMLREMAATGSALGQKVKAIIDKGELVSNDIMFQILEAKLLSPECSHGVIFDGFPRNIAQAEELNHILSKHGKHLDCVIEFRVPDEELVGRITGRLIHEPSGRTYHIKNNPPKAPMKDDVTGEPLIQRPDDNAKVLTDRLKIYHQQTQPLVEYYKKAGLLKSIDAAKPLQTVLSEVQHAIQTSHK